MKESLYSQAPGLVLRETFQSKQQVLKNGGTLTDVIFNGGVGTFNGTSSFISFDSQVGKIKNQYSGTVKIKALFKKYVSTTVVFSITDPTTSNFIIIQQRAGSILSASLRNGLGDRWRIDINSAIPSDVYLNIVLAHNGTEPTLYVNGVKPAQTFAVSTAKTDWIKNIVATGISLGNLRFNGASTQFHNGNIDLVEIYNYAWTAEQVANDYNNVTFKDVRDGLVLDIDSRKGAIKDNIGIIPITTNTMQIKRHGSYYQMLSAADGEAIIMEESDVLRPGPTGEFSYSLWYRINEYKGNSSSNDNLNIIQYERTHLYIDHASKALSTALGGSGVSTGFVPKEKKWNHVVLTYNNTALRVYVDGSLKYSATVTLEAQDGRDLQLSALTRNDGGYHNQFRYYTTALTAAEATQLYTSQRNFYNA